MHETSFAKMRAFVDAYLAPLRDMPLAVLDVGAQAVDAHSSYRPLFDIPGWRYRGLDMAAGRNVDIVVADPYDWREVPDASVDAVISGQALEHIELPWRTIIQIARVLRPGGLACLIAPSAGPEHRYPNDCWRFYPDGMASLARSAGLDVVELFTDWGVLPWQDSFAVLQKPVRPGEAAVMPPQSDLRIAFGVYRAALGTGLLAPLYYTTLAKLQHAAGGVTEAIATLRIGTAAHSEAPELRHELVRLMLLNGQTHAALEQAMTLLRLRPISPATVDAVGAALRQADPEGRSLLAAMLPTVPAALVQLATQAAHREHWALAVLAWTKAGRLSPPPANAGLQRALALLGDKQFDAARDAFVFERCAQIDRGDINRTTVIQRLIEARGACSYLEIGVERGTHFFQIEAQVKMAVDPNFKIPGGWRNTGCESFYPVTSDAFFADPPPLLRQRGIDVALVDGLHTYAQSLRDIENCLRHLNAGGIVVVHDCLPGSVAESAPAQDLARKLPGFTGTWTGDVYRAIVELRSRRPDLWIAVLDTDHGIGLVKPGAAESMLALEPEAVASLSYENLSAGRTGLLNLKPARWFDDWLSRGGRASSEDMDARPLDPYGSAFSPSVLEYIQHGVMKTGYKGVRLQKSPLDLALYLQLLQRLQPRTVIEVGTLDGGSAVWFADQMQALGLEAKLISVDKTSRPLLRDARVRFLEGDALRLEAPLDDALLADLPRPWLVIEDSAHTYDVCLAVLRFFDRHLALGDYIVVEDGILRHLPGAAYRRYEDGPSRALAAFLAERGAVYEVDRSLCDFYGHNMTYNPSGYLRRIS